MELDQRLQADAARRARELRLMARELRADADRRDAQAERIEETWQIDSEGNALTDAMEQLEGAWASAV